MPPRKAKKSEAKKLVSHSRFKCLPVKKRISIREFIKANDLEFATGKGFYQLTKPETIQDNKEIVARRKSDGKIVTGDEVCEKFYFTLLYSTCKFFKNVMASPQPLLVSSQNVPRLKRPRLCAVKTSPGQNVPMPKTPNSCVQI
jgi:hypothetical protein